MGIKLSQNIKSLRTERGIRQKEFAEALSVTPQSVSRWETGQAYPDIEMLPRIADYFDLSVDELLGVGESFTARKLQQLNEARANVKEELDFSNRRQVCSILEELAANGERQIQFLQEALSLYHLGGIDVEVVERAREYCQDMLSKSSGDDLIRKLQNIVLNEEEQNVDRWRRYVSNDSFFACWDDLLFIRYTYGNKQHELWEPTRQRIVHDTLMKLIQNLIRGVPDHNCKVNSYVLSTLSPYENHKVALGILDLFSNDEADIYIGLRVYVEIRMTAVLFGMGRDEEGFLMLDSLASHIHAFEGLKNRTAKGSVSFLAEIEQFISDDDIKNYVTDVYAELHLPQFDRVRNDRRFLNFYRMVEANYYEE